MPKLTKLTIGYYPKRKNGFPYCISYFYNTMRIKENHSSIKNVQKAIKDILLKAQTEN